MEVRAAEFQKWAIKVICYGKENTEQNHHACIVPAPFCVTDVFNDERYLQSDGRDKMITKLSVRKRNVKLVQMIDVETPCNVISHTLIDVEALRNTK